MVEKYYYEFSKLYCRIMRLEMLIKQKITSSLIGYYKEEIISVFEKFLKNKNRLERYNNKTGNSINAILNNPQISKASQKFANIVNILYFSDVLFIFLCCKEFRKTEILKNFYYRIPSKYSKLISSRLFLLDLRNVIAHYNFKNYDLNKNIYNETLYVFEYYIGHNIAGITELPKFNNKPSIKTILLELKKLKPDLFEINIEKDDEIKSFYNKHRLLLDICDEIALYNGYEIKELPSPWTILRQVYNINEENTEEIHSSYK